MNQTIKYVSITAVLQLVTTVGAISFWSGGLEKDVNINSTAIAENKQSIDKLTSKLEEDIDQLKSNSNNMQSDIRVIMFLLGASDIEKPNDIGAIFN